MRSVGFQPTQAGSNPVRGTKIMTILFIDVPHNYPHDWTISKDVQQVLKTMWNVKEVVFICNSVAKLSVGDLYEVRLRDDDCAEFFVLRTGLKPVTPNEYILGRIARYANAEDGDL